MNRNQEAASNFIETVGIIVPAEWDGNGSPSAWAISTYDEKFYHIDTSGGEGSSMVLFPGRAIRVFGYFKKNENERRQITVEKFMFVNDLETLK